MKCYTNDNIIILFLHVDIDVVTWHYIIIVISFLTSSLFGNQFTEKGQTQLREAAAERNRYPDFVKLGLFV